MKQLKKSEKLLINDFFLYYQFFFVDEGKNDEKLFLSFRKWSVNININICQSKNLFKKFVD